ncbi:MAG: Hsp20/alpha crystallin family protein [Gemmatimonadota bacterium]
MMGDYTEDQGLEQDVTVETVEPGPEDETLHDKQCCTDEECGRGDEKGWRGRRWAGSAWGQPISDIGDMMGDIFEAVRGVPHFVGRYPALDVVEGEDEFLVFVDVPGLDRSDLELKVDGTTLTIGGTRTRPEEFTKRQTRRAERSFGTFKRTVTVPAEADSDRISARLTSGVLTITMPRKTDSPEGRSIDID